MGDGRLGDSWAMGDQNQEAEDRGQEVEVWKRGRRAKGDSTLSTPASAYLPGPGSNLSAFRLRRHACWAGRPCMAPWAIGVRAGWYPNY
jgi:hypothetical protein